jgi:hypothetical protein
VPSMLTAMRWEYLSIWTVTSARTGAIANADIAAPANIGPASRFMIAPAFQFLLRARCGFEMQVVKIGAAR